MFSNEHGRRLRVVARGEPRCLPISADHAIALLPIPADRAIAVLPILPPTLLPSTRQRRTFTADERPRKRSDRTEAQRANRSAASDSTRFESQHSASNGDLLFTAETYRNQNLQSEITCEGRRGERCEQPRDELIAWNTRGWSSQVTAGCAVCVGIQNGEMREPAHVMTSDATRAT
jgi:hypothetical protein